MNRDKKQVSFLGISILKPSRMSVVRFLSMVLFGSVVYCLVDWHNVWKGLSKLTVGVITLSLGVCLIRNWLLGYRWKCLNSDTSSFFPIWRYFVYVMCSNTFNLVMPGALGGDFIRATLIYKQIYNHRGENVLSVFTDRLVGLFSILCIGGVVAIVVPELPDRGRYFAFVGAMLVGFVALLVLVFQHRWLLRFEKALQKRGKIGQMSCKFLETLRSAIKYYRQQPRSLIEALLLCVPIHLCSFFVFYIIMTVLGAGLNFFQVMAVASLLWVILAIPVSIAGFGVRELTLVYLLAPYGVSASLATAISLGYFAVGVALGTVGIPFVYLAIKNKRTGLKNKYESI